MAKKICILALITILFSLSSPWIDPAVASLPNCNRLKDPYAILRNSLPIDQKELATISGVGQGKANRYGGPFLDLINNLFLKFFLTR